MNTNLLHHLTLNTGHLSVHRTDTFAPEAVAACRALLDGGQLPAPYAAFRVDVTLMRDVDGAMFFLKQDRKIIVQCVVACDQAANDELWPIIPKLAIEFLGLKINRPPLPYCAVLLLPSIATQSPEDLAWMGGWERCMAAAIMEASR